MFSIIDKDLGTPAPRAPRNVGQKTVIAEAPAKQVTLSIDGREVTVAEGTSVMRAAALADINIPKLCATDTLEAFGSCRLCLVQIEGMRGYPASCTTLVADGMKVVTQNDKLADLRRGVMELYISDHPLDCLTCPANGHCELQDMAGAVGLREVRYGYEGENHVHPKVDGKLNERFQPKDESNPYFMFDPSKCIVCSRCVRALRRAAGDAGADHLRPRFRLESQRQPGRSLHGLGVRVLRGLRRRLPDCNTQREIADRQGPGRAQRHHHLRLLRCRL